VAQPDAVADLHTESNRFSVHDAESDGFAHACCADRYIHTCTQSDSDASPDQYAAAVHPLSHTDIYLYPVIHPVRRQPVSDVHADAESHADPISPQPNLNAHVDAAPHANVNNTSHSDVHPHCDADAIRQVVQLDVVEASFAGQTWTQDVFVVEYGAGRS
jgi:hypothetical protein